jgi:hypothetical protein
MCSSIKPVSRMDPDRKLSSFIDESYGLASS